MQPSSLAKRGNILLLFAVIGFYFYGLGHLSLVGPDEPRYAQIAREMFLRHDLISPTLGGHLWFEKPALLYWMMIASFKLFGVSEWSARFPAAFSGVLTVAALFFVVRRAAHSETHEQLREWHFWSALASATTGGIMVFSRAATFDIVLTMTTTWALALFIVHEFEEDPKTRQRFLAGFYAFVGLSLLAKGLVGIVIPIGVVCVYYILRRRFPERKTYFSLLWGIPLALLVAATWYAPVIWRHGWPFIDQFFIQQHFARYVTNKYHHPQPVYFYLGILPLLSLPWTIFLIGGFLKARTWPWRAGDPINKLLVFALAWILFPLIFFTFSNSKLPGYILPVLPAAALIVGERLSRFSYDSKDSTWTLRATAALYLLFAAVLPIFAWHSGGLSLHCALAMASPLLAVGGFALLTRRREAAILLIAFTSLATIIFTLYCVAPRWVERESTKRLIQLADSRGYSQAVIYGLPRDDRTPEFYAAGRVVYGANGDPVTYSDTSQIIAETYTRRQPILVFVPLKEMNQLMGVSSIATDVLGDNGRFALVAVRPR